MSLHEAISSAQGSQTSPRLTHPTFRLALSSFAVARSHRSLRCRHKRVTTTAAAQTSVKTDSRLPRWEYIYGQLVDRGVKTIKPLEAAELTEKGYVLVDVRPRHIYEKAHPKGAKNAPLFQRVDFSKPSLTSLLRATALALNGVEPVEPNPQFGEDVLAAAGKDGKIILACEAGGTLVPNSSFQFGKESRSLKAAYKALECNSFSEVLHLGGGVYGWYKAGLPFNGEYDLENGGLPML